MISRIGALIKSGTWIICAVAALLVLGETGCGKKANTGKPQSVQEGLDRLREVMVTAKPEVQDVLYKEVSYKIRYGNYVEALMGLENISKDPSLTPAQKKAVNDYFEYLKTKTAEQNAGAPAQ